MSLRRIIYLSSATQLFDDAALNELLVQARQRNQSAGVTGLLMYAEGSFLQVLEGAPDAVDLIYRSIEADARHRHIILAENSAAEAREFADWSMAFEQPETPTGEVEPGFLALRRSILEDANRVKSSDILDFMARNFMDNTRFD